MNKFDPNGETQLLPPGSELFHHWDDSAEPSETQTERLPIIV